LLKFNFGVERARNPSGLAQPVINGALNPVIGKGLKIDVKLGIEALGGLEESEPGVTDNFFDVGIVRESLCNLVRDGSGVRQILVNEALSVRQVLCGGSH